MVLKKELAAILVEMYHCPDDARRAEKDFEQKFSRREIPDDLPELAISGPDQFVWIVKAIVLSNLAFSNNAAIRLIQGGGVELNGSKISDKDYKIDLAQNNVLKIGKKNFFRLKWHK